MPAGMFFEGHDYNPLNEKTMSILDTQRRVVRHRRDRKSDLHQVLDDLVRLNAAAHAADRQGNLAAHWDSLLSAAAQLSELVKKAGKQIDAAESRYEEFFESPPPVPPAGASSPSAPAGPPPAVGSAAIVVTMDKPSSIAFPGSAAYLSRQGQVNGMMRGRS
ncbi:hypothetical protein [Arthrobacter sp. SDTb3-6]|uniref:hypothetical protein n=1 Tax=Arthrobacter sp. SDTb3-6 TaxID=2713571 RepID=UPI00159DD4B7|nr:hypothetical protein [Arthrobacter sp. SDTb3-6]NVM97801.1 hypothetical protein [Arthrobacter sp. SDTb3-6]